MRRVSIQLARLLSAGALLAMLPLVLHAAGSAELLPLRETFPPGSIDSTERADQALAAVDARRALLQSDYIERERECYKKFFSNNCIEDLKASKRMQDADFDSVALEANRFMRNLADQNNKRRKKRLMPGPTRPATPPSVARIGWATSKSSKAPIKSSATRRRAVAWTPATQRPIALRSPTTRSNKKTALPRTCRPSPRPSSQKPTRRRRKTMPPQGVTVLPGIALTRQPIAPDEPPRRWPMVSRRLRAARP
jgi:hypothetical protein